MRRTYWLARGPGAQAPLLMMLPGSGTTGQDIATTLTGLARAIGPIPRQLDATGILLDTVTEGHDQPSFYHDMRT